MKIIFIIFLKLFLKLVYTRIHTSHILLTIIFLFSMSSSRDQIDKLNYFLEYTNVLSVIYLISGDNLN